MEISDEQGRLILRVLWMLPIPWKLMEALNHAVHCSPLSLSKAPWIISIRKATENRQNATVFSSGRICQSHLFMKPVINARSLLQRGTKQPTMKSESTSTDDASKCWELSDLHQSWIIWCTFEQNALAEMDYMKYPCGSQCKWKTTKHWTEIKSSKIFSLRMCCKALTVFTAGLFISVFRQSALFFGPESPDVSAIEPCYSLLLCDCQLKRHAFLSVYRQK